MKPTTILSFLAALTLTSAAPQGTPSIYDPSTTSELASAPTPTARDAPTWDDSWILAGPASYEELQGTVAQMKANGSHTGTITSRSEGYLEKRVVQCEGVYMCGLKNFKGSCYYACYPISKAIHPDRYWAKRISSVGPDKGGWCLFYGGPACNDEKYVHTYVRHPGGNLGPKINNKMGCFYCNPL